MIFKNLIMVYSLFIMAILAIVYHRSGKLIKINKSPSFHEAEATGVKKYLLVIVALIPFLMVSYRILCYFPSFSEVDTSAYLYDVVQIERVGGITPYDMKENVYYRGFPIFTLISVIFKTVTSVDIFQVYISLNLLYVLLFSTWSYIICRRLFGRNSVYALMLPLVIIGNPYLLLTLHYFVPYLLSLSVNVLFIYLILLRCSILKISKSLVLIYLLVNVLCLNHAELMYFSVFILLIYVFSRLFDFKELSAQFVVLPWVIFWFYICYNTLFAINLRVFWKALISILQPIFKLSAQMIRIESLEHPYPFINAIAYSISISVTLCISLMFIVDLLRGKRIKQMSDLIFNVLALLLSFAFFLGTLWQSYGSVDLGNTLMYTFITAFILAPVLCLYYIKRIAICHWHTLFFTSLLFMGLLGSLTEPLAILDQNSSYFLSKGEFNQAKNMASYICSFYSDTITICTSSRKVIPYLDILCTHPIKTFFNLHLEYANKVFDLGNLSIFT